MEIRIKHFAAGFEAGFEAGLKGLKAMEIGAKQYDKSPSWLSWYDVTLVVLTDCRWWFDSPLVRE